MAIQSPTGPSVDQWAKPFNMEPIKPIEIKPDVNFQPDFTGVQNFGDAGAYAAPLTAPEAVTPSGGGGLLSASRPNIPPPDPKLIGQQQGYTPGSASGQGYEARGYNAQSIGVSPNATVSGRLTQLIDENSRYIQQARQRAAQDMNGRGMLNSTMMAEAGQRAAIDAVLPIAQGDSSVYNQRELASMDAGNRAREFTAGAQNQASQFSSQLDAEMSRFNTGQQNEAARWQSQLDAETNRFNTETQNNMATTQWATLNDNQQQEFMANLTSQLNQDQALRLAQFNQNASRLANADSVYGNMMGSNAQAMMNALTTPGLTGPQRDALINTLTTQGESFTNFYNAINGIR